MRAFIVLASCGVFSLCAVLAACSEGEPAPGEQPGADGGVGPGATDSGLKPGTEIDGGPSSVDSGKPGVTPRDQWVRLAAPVSGDLSSVRIANASTIWIGGTAGLFRAQGLTVKQVDLGSPVSIGGLARSAGDVTVAVGTSGGKAVAFTNGSIPWESYDPPSTAVIKGLNSVAAHGLRDFVACSDEGAPISYDSAGSFGSPIKYAIQGRLSDCRRVAKDGSGGYWLVGAFRLYYYDTRTMYGFSVETNEIKSLSAEQIDITTEDMASVTEAGKTALFLAGSRSGKARIMRRVGQAPFETITSARSETITAIAPVTSDDAWFATATGGIGRYKAGTLRWGTLPGAGTPTAIDATGERIWVVGKDGAIWFCEGNCESGFQTEDGGLTDAGTTD
jgi:hypothetical protein